MDWHILALRSLIIIFIISIGWSLATALYYLLKPGASKSGKMAKALTFRIGLSVTLFLILVGCAYFGVFQLHSI